MKPGIEFPDPVSEEARQRDALLHAAVARATAGISPISVSIAMLDWLAHLSTAPGKQYELLQKAQRKLFRLALFAAYVTEDCPRCIEPLPQDRRFLHPYWDKWPFALYYQSFLLAQQWWWNATTNVRGVSAHHEQMVTFLMRQWLDVFSPSNYVLTNPEVLEETWRSAGTNLVRGAQNAWEDALRLAANRPPAGAERYEVGRDVATTPGKVVYRNRLVELIQYAAQTEKVRPEPVLVVPSWIMKYYVLDLSPSNSLVGYLVRNGYTVFMISWKNPGAEDRELDMDAYLRFGIGESLQAVSTIVPGRPIHSLGYCLGGTLLSIAASAQARRGEGRLASMSLLASEVDFAEPGELGLFIDESQIAFLEDVVWARGYLDGKEMSGAFTLLNSKDLVWSKMVRDYLMGRRQPLSDLMAWNADATRLPFRMHSECLRRLYLDNELASGCYRVEGRTVALSDIRLPMFVLGTERDHVSPWRSVYKLHLLTPTEVTFVLTTGGHNVGVVNPPGTGAPGRGYRVAMRPREGAYLSPEHWYETARWHEGSWWPELLSWLAARSGDPVAPPAMDAAGSGLPALADAPGTYVRVP